MKLNTASFAAESPMHEMDFNSTVAGFCGRKYKVIKEEKIDEDIIQYEIKTDAPLQELQNCSRDVKGPLILSTLSMCGLDQNHLIKEKIAELPPPNKRKRGAFDPWLARLPATKSTTGRAGKAK